MFVSVENVLCFDRGMHPGYHHLAGVLLINSTHFLVIAVSFSRWSLADGHMVLLALPGAVQQPGEAVPVRVLPQVLWQKEDAAAPQRQVRSAPPARR